MDKLPSEIIQLILYHLEDNQSSLANINSTCKSLYYASLHHLYQQPRFSTIQRFQSFIQNLNEKAAKCIQTIDLSLTAHRWEPIMNTLILHLTHEAKNIEHLNLCLCHLEAGVLYSCAKTFNRLQYLSINGNRHVDDISLAAMIPFLKELRGLDIGATAIRDRSLVLIAKHCKKLESLDVSDCHRITEVGIRCVTTELSHLNYLSIENCYNVVSMDGEFDGITVEEEGDWEDEDEDDESDEQGEENEQLAQ